MAATLADTVIRRRLLTYLKNHRCARTKYIARSTRSPILRTDMILTELEREGEIVRIADGQHRGKPVMAWALPEHAPQRVTYRADETLRAFQAAARARLSSNEPLMLEAA